MKQNRIDLLEGLVDGDSLKDVVEALGQICMEKAAHIRENWQDNMTAKHWDRAATALFRAAAKVTV